jgi:signal transduction histidine kinase
MTQGQDLLAARADGDQLPAEAERTMLDLRLREARLHEARRLESLGQLAGGVAHDFNNLLAVVLNYASFVSEEITAAAAESTDNRWQAVLDDVGQIQHAAERATALTRQLLAFGRRGATQPKVLNLGEAVTRLEQKLRELAGDAVGVTIAVQQGVGPVFADRDQLEQVLVNLVENAREAMPDGGDLTIETAQVDLDEDAAAVRIGLRPGQHARLRVLDAGVGIAQDVLDMVFEPFFTTKVKGEGSGLGLATVYGVISQFGGHTEITSEVGVGTTVTCLLPVAATEAVDTGPLRPVTAGTVDRVAQPGGGETILLVEDEDAMRELTRRILSRNGYQVLTASGAAEAIELVGRQDDARDDIDLLITDVIMPGMHGRELATLIRALLPAVRVTYMSGYAHPVLATHGQLDPGALLLKKPFTEEILLETVRRTLDHG